MRSILRLAVLLVVTVLAGSASAQIPQSAQWPEVQGRGICYSQLGWCPLPNPERTPVGIPCYCVLPDNRYVAGTTSPMRYWGRVSPYFNLHPPAIPTVIK